MDSQSLINDSTPEQQINQKETKLNSEKTRAHSEDEVKLDTRNKKRRNSDHKTAFKSFFNIWKRKSSQHNGKGKTSFREPLEESEKAVQTVTREKKDLHNVSDKNANHEKESTATQNCRNSSQEDNILGNNENDQANKLSDTAVKTTNKPELLCSKRLNPSLLKNIAQISAVVAKSKNGPQTYRPSSSSPNSPSSSAYNENLLLSDDVFFSSFSESNGPQLTNDSKTISAEQKITTNKSIQCNQQSLLVSNTKTRNKGPPNRRRPTAKT